MSGPRVTTGAESKQDYATPPEFIAAVEKLLGPIRFDLAAHANNTKHERYFTPAGLDDREAYGQDAFAHNWAVISREFMSPNGGPGLLWLNPPFDDIGRWAAKCAASAQEGASVAFLTPASVGSNWFRDHVAPHADVYLLNGRISFDGDNLYPKDCMLSHFGRAVSGGEHPAGPGIRIWDWRNEVVHSRWGSVRS